LFHTKVVPASRLIIVIIIVILLLLFRIKVVEKIKTRILNIFLTVNLAVHEIEKCATVDNIASCALHAG